MKTSFGCGMPMDRGFCSIDRTNRGLLAKKKLEDINSEEYFYTALNA
jgi:hypothetical protein